MPCTNPDDSDVGLVVTHQLFVSNGEFPVLCSLTPRNKGLIRDRDRFAWPPLQNKAEALKPTQNENGGDHTPSTNELPWGLPLDFRRCHLYSIETTPICCPSPLHRLFLRSFGPALREITERLRHGRQCLIIKRSPKVPSCERNDNSGLFAIPNPLGRVPGWIVFHCPLLLHGKHPGINRYDPES